MGYTKKIKAGLVQQDYTQFVGEPGTLFYNYDNGTLRLSDGVTPGGTAVNLIGDFNDIAIGNITVDGTTISPNTPNSAINIASTGTAQINLVGRVHVHSDGNVAGTPSISVKSDGQVVMLVPHVDSIQGAVNIVGNATGAYVNPQNTGVMLHITGQQSDPGRLYLDSVGERAVYAGRRYNGTPESPTAVLNNEIIARYGGTPYTSTGWPTLTTARIDFVANENQTGSAQGSRIEFWSTPVGSTTPTRQGYYDGTGLNAINLTTTGRANITNMNVTTNTPVLTVSANAQGLTKVAAVGGTIAQFTHKDAQRGLVIQDNYGIDPSVLTTGGNYTFRTARGTNASPTAVQSGDILGEIGGAGWGATGYGGIFAASLRFVANENFSDSARGGKAVIRLIPQGSNTPLDALTLTPSSLTLATGASITGRLRATAGTTSDPSIQLEAGPLPTVSVPGAITYNGVALYAVPQDGEIGVLPAEQTFVLNATRNLTAGVTTAQSIFGKTVHVSANTRYHYVLNAVVLKNGSSSNTPTLNYGLALNAGASLFAHGYQCISSVGTSGAAITEIRSSSMMSNYLTTGFSTGVPVTAAMAVATAYATIEIRGWFSTNLAGTIDFQLAFSDAPNTSCSVQPTSSVRMYPVSAAGADTSIGTWA